MGEEDVAAPPLRLLAAEAFGAIGQ